MLSLHSANFIRVNFHIIKWEAKSAAKLKQTFFQHCSKLAKKTIIINIVVSSAPAFRKCRRIKIPLQTYDFSPTGRKCSNSVAVEAIEASQNLLKSLKIPLRTTHDSICESVLRSGVLNNEHLFHISFFFFF